MALILSDKKRQSVRIQPRGRVASIETFNERYYHVETYSNQQQAPHLYYYERAARRTTMTQYGRCNWTWLALYTSLTRTESLEANSVTRFFLFDTSNKMMTKRESRTKHHGTTATVAGHRLKLPARITNKQSLNERTRKGFRAEARISERAT